MTPPIGWRSWCRGRRIWQVKVRGERWRRGWRGGKRWGRCSSISVYSFIFWFRFIIYLEFDRWLIHSWFAGRRWWWVKWWRAVDHGRIKLVKLCRMWRWCHMTLPLNLVVVQLSLINIVPFFAFCFLYFFGGLGLAIWRKQKLVSQELGASYVSVPYLFTLCLMIM